MSEILLFMPLSVLLMDTEKYQHLRDLSGSSESSLCLSSHSPSYSASHTAHASIRNSYDDWEGPEVDKEREKEKENEQEGREKDLEVELEIEMEFERGRERERERERESEREAEDKDRIDELRMSASCRKGKNITDNLNLLNRAALWLSRDNSTLGPAPAPGHPHTHGQGAGQRTGLGLGGHCSAPLLADITPNNSPSYSSSSGSFSERARSLSSPTLSSSSTQRSNNDSKTAAVSPMESPSHTTTAAAAATAATATAATATAAATAAAAAGVLPRSASQLEMLTEAQSLLSLSSSSAGSTTKTAAAAAAVAASHEVVAPVRKLLRTHATDLNLARLAPIVGALQKNPSTHPNPSTTLRTVIPRYRQNTFAPSSPVPALQLSGLFHAVSEDDSTVKRKMKGRGQGQGKGRGQRPPNVPLLLLETLSPQQRLQSSVDACSASVSRTGSGSGSASYMSVGTGSVGGVGMSRQYSSASVSSNNSVSSSSKTHPVAAGLVYSSARYCTRFSNNFLIVVSSFSLLLVLLLSFISSFIYFLFSTIPFILLSPSHLLFFSFSK